MPIVKTQVLTYVTTDVEVAVTFPLYRLRSKCNLDSYDETVYERIDEHQCIKITVRENCSTQFNFDNRSVEIYPTQIEGESQEFLMGGGAHALTKAEFDSEFSKVITELTKAGISQ